MTPFFSESWTGVGSWKLAGLLCIHGLGNRCLWPLQEVREAVCHRLRKASCLAELVDMKAAELCWTWHRLSCRSQPQHRSGQREPSWRWIDAARNAWWSKLIAAGLLMCGCSLLPCRR